VLSAPASSFPTSTSEGDLLDSTKFGSSDSTGWEAFKLNAGEKLLALEAGEAYLLMMELISIEECDECCVEVADWEKLESGGSSLEALLEVGGGDIEWSWRSWGEVKEGTVVDGSEFADEVSFWLSGSLDLTGIWVNWIQVDEIVRGCREKIVADRG
jgi:hypothetical protein